MVQLRDDEVRRLISYLRKQTDDLEALAAIEDELRDDEAEDFLRAPEILTYFPALTEAVTCLDKTWQLLVLPHAHLRMVQRGVKKQAVVDIFSRFIEYCAAEGELITIGTYAIYDQAASITLRIDVDSIAEAGGNSHVVTVFSGHSYRPNQTEVILM